jgi:hypothetical protein
VLRFEKNKVKYKKRGVVFFKTENFQRNKMWREKKVPAIPDTPRSYAEIRTRLFILPNSGAVQYSKNGSSLKKQLKPGVNT